VVKRGRTRKKLPSTPALLAFLISVSFTPTVIATETLEDVQESPDLQLHTVSTTDPNILWNDYLDETGLVDGFNLLGDMPYFIASGSSTVHRPFGKGWIAARNAAFDKALVQAKAEIAEYVETTIESSQSLELFQRSGDGLAPEINDLVKADQQLSIVQKGHRLAHAELDELITRHDPNWDGTGVTPEERERKIVVERERLQQAGSSRSRLLVQGASPIFNAEGPDDRGHYVVMVGLVWSPRSSALARSLHDPSVIAPAGKPGKPVLTSIADSMRNDPTFLASFNGVRVWRDENGVRVLVSSASSERGLNDSTSRRRNTYTAKRQIASFVAETIVAEQQMDGSMTDDMYKDETVYTYDETTFNDRVSAVVDAIPLAGVAKVHEWRGKHPVSGTPMLVTIMSWSPDSMRQAGAIARSVKPRSDSAVATDEAGTADNTTNRRRSLVGPKATIDDF